MLTLSDRLRPPGDRLRRRLDPCLPAVAPPTLLAEAERVAAHVGARARAARRDRVPAAARRADDGVHVVEVAARIPGGQMADLVRHAVGVDLVEIALRQALGEPVPDELVAPRGAQPLAIRFLTAEPGPLPTGRVDARSGRSTRCSRRRASCRRTPTSQVGETIRPVRLDGDRRGYVIAVGDTADEALEPRRGGGARCSRSRSSDRMTLRVLLAPLRELLEAAQAGGYRFAFFDRRAAGRRRAAAPRRRPVARGSGRDGRARGGARRRARPTS